MVALCSYECFANNHQDEHYIKSSSRGDGGGGAPSDAETVGKIICEAFDHALKNEQFSPTPSQGSIEAKVMSCTQSSVAKLRGQSSLSQENGVSSIGDVMAIGYQYPIKKTLLDEKTSFRDSQSIQLLQRLKIHAINFLQEYKYDDLSSLYSYPEQQSVISNIQILSSKIVPRDKRFHAESYCTQRRYRYLLPLKWLKGGHNIEKWWLNNKDTISRRSDHQGLRRRPRPPNELRDFKRLLRSFESRNKVANDDKNIYDGSKSRYGLLAQKSFRPWHNFADPTIRGGAVSPSNKPVWRALDRCRIVQFTSANDDYEYNGSTKDEHVFAVIEFRGDDFVQQQIRRIVGSAVAINNGWLPQSFVEYATRPDVIVETPLAPCQRLYQTRPQYHFYQLSNKGLSVFHDDMNEQNGVALTKNIHDRIFEKTMAKQVYEDQWLLDLRQIVAPRINDQLKPVFETIDDDLKMQMNAMQLERLAPVKYVKTLSLLRNISSSGRWPATSLARSRVIKDKNKDFTIEESIGNSNGSFTIINPKYLDGILMNEDSHIRLPLGNGLFPDLVDAIFELETMLADELFASDNSNKNRGVRRLQSSHCAVNQNAQFNPHVDSGRGYGQSMSMIVGLGSYSGGSLFVEDELFDICYKPLEFDGWRDRHWTQPFEGERFSLVWFTPQMKGVND
jgi:tRNA U38,U39,U40 pseudouridine synthase TruA